MTHIKLLWKDCDGDLHKTQYDNVIAIEKDKDGDDTVFIIVMQDARATFFEWEIVRINL